MRVKRGTVRKRKHNKIKKLAKGFRGRRKSCYKLAKLAVEKSLQYQYRDRKVRKREFRALWIQRINAAARQFGIPYSRFIKGLALAGIVIDRKSLCALAINDVPAFGVIAERVKSVLSTPVASVSAH
jgi:large subunit ribosomal protein L20